MSTLKVNTIKNSTGTDAVTIAGDGKVTFPVGGTQLAMQKVAASNTAQTNITSLVLDLPTTTDFLVLKLYLYGVRHKSNVDNRWAIQLRQQSNSTYFTSSNYAGQGMNPYSNNTGTAGESNYLFTSQNHGWLTQSHHPGQANNAGWDEHAFEMTIYGTNNDTNWTRTTHHTSLEYSNNAHYYMSVGSMALQNVALIDQLKFLTTTNSAFDLRSYGLYKIMV